MFNLRNKIDRFCYNHPNFGISNLMKYVAIANVAFWLMNVINPTFLQYIIFDPALIMRGQVWRVISFMFYPPNTGVLALLVFYFYYWIGSILEREWGSGPFTIFLFSGILLTVIYGFVMYFVFGYSIMLDSSYIFLSMFFSFAAMYPDMQVLFMFIIPVRMKFLALIDAVFFLMAVLSNPFPINLLPVVALLNFFIFCAGDPKAFLPRKASNSTINFRKESARIRYEQQSKLYTHKCSVCGRTDVDYPDLEFRYCSRCEGYHCFCSEHINNHIHFTE
ncbi:MAG: hypothetical protein IIX72_01675 [Oscillospiraceae bacterium]|nr:hypothetical protein [Oscillospiraceae bacterium]